MKKEDVKVKVSDHVLFVSTERHYENTHQDANFWRIERQYGTASRSLVLPSNADEDKITAKQEHGILHLHVPKLETDNFTEKSVDIK